MNNLNNDSIALIYKGEDFPLRLLMKKTNGKYYDLTGATEITLRLKKQDGSILEKKYTLSQVIIVSLIGGEILVTLSDADTTLLLEKDLQDFDVVVDKGTSRRIAFFSKRLSVRKALA